MTIGILSQRNLTDVSFVRQCSFLRHFLHSQNENLMCGEKQTHKQKHTNISGWIIFLVTHTAQSGFAGPRSNKNCDGPSSKPGI